MRRFHIDYFTSIYVIFSSKKQNFFPSVGSIIFRSMKSCSKTYFTSKKVVVVENLQQKRKIVCFLFSSKVIQK